MTNYKIIHRAVSCLLSLMLIISAAIPAAAATVTDEQRQEWEQLQPGIEERDFTGEIIHPVGSAARYVRFHVRATSDLGAEPYFYMWYYKNASPETTNPNYNEYAASSIVNGLTFNRAYAKVQNDSWGSDGPEGECAMSYEGNGWYVTKKTFNVNRNVHFVNAIITKTDAQRYNNGTFQDDQQSWEFFGLPVPMENELGKQNGIDI